MFYKVRNKDTIYKNETVFHWTDPRSFFFKKVPKTTIRILQILVEFFKNSENSVGKAAEFSKQLNSKYKAFWWMECVAISEW